MDEISGLAEMRAWSRARARDGARIGFVPTMGYLHEGHLRLVDRARECGDLVILSIFVNPLQFGPSEDFARYPRDLDRDRALAAERGVDRLFVPDARTMYPTEPSVRVTPPEGALGDSLEGAARPGHFAGVLTVVAKLFQIVAPHVAVFGRKDYQQARLVRRMVDDLDFPLTIEVAPTVRDRDGLALSSRNAYLSPAQRRSALALSGALGAVETAWREGLTDATALRDRGMQVLAAPGVQPEYLALVDEALQPVRQATPRTVALVAARVGVTRLIDNVVLGDGVAADPTVG